MIEAIVYEQRNIFVSKLIDRRNFQTRPKYGINSVHYRTVKLKYCYIPFPIIESLCHCDHLFRLSLSRKRNRIAVSVITVCPQDKLRVGTAIQSTSIIRMCQNMTKCAVEQVGHVITVLALHKRWLSLGIARLDWTRLEVRVMSHYLCCLPASFCSLLLPIVLEHNKRHEFLVLLIVMQTDCHASQFLFLNLSEASRHLDNCSAKRGDWRLCCLLQNGVT